uniref:HTH_48 domain-containing protein n=1 Tax=Caenorhabditis tropicalis TaxID=1561998 RepID=A0A1I7U6J1_9PELO
MATPSNNPVRLSREQVRLLLFYEHRSGSSTRKAVDQINLLIGPGTVNQATAVRWFQKFRNGVVDFEDSPHNGRPKEIEEDELLALVKEDPRQSTRSLATKLGYSQIYFLHDNARPHVAKVTRQKIQELGWMILPHPPYSPDMAPTDYHLFRSLNHFLDGKEFHNQDDLRTAIQSFFDNKPRDFYRNGIEQLPTRWQYIVNNDGAYYVD